METKKWYQSITMWAAKIIVVLQVAPIVVLWLDSNFGLSLSTNPFVINFLTAIAAIVAAYGRFTAKTTLIK